MTTIIAAKKSKMLVGLTLILMLLFAMIFRVAAYIESGYLWSGNLATVGRYIHHSSLYCPNVTTAQWIVTLYPGLSCDPDGWFGSATTQAVKDYQTVRGLTSDGIVGPNTWENMQYRLEYVLTDNYGSDCYGINIEASDYGGDIMTNVT